MCLFLSVVHSSIRALLKNLDDPLLSSDLLRIDAQESHMAFVTNVVVIGADSLKLIQ